jgi:hypothetical protein
MGGRHVGPQLDDLPSVGRKDHGVLVGAAGDIASLDEIGDRWVAVRVPLHDVTPVSPDRPQIQQDEAVLPLCLGEGCLGPALPRDAAIRGPGQGVKPRRTKNIKLMIRSEELSLVSAAPLPGL